jgi:hypothetical protein
VVAAERAAAEEILGLAALVAVVPVEELQTTRVDKIQT